MRVEVSMQPNRVDANWSRPANCLHENHLHCWMKPLYSLAASLSGFAFFCSPGGSCGRV